MNYYLGIDFGTSGARGIVIDQEKNIIDTTKEIKAIAINGTSSTVLLCDAIGKVIAEPILYNDISGKEVLDKIKMVAPQDHVVISASSSLAKLWWWSKQPYFKQARYLLHQADWLGFLLHGKLGISDYHNSLKLGYDVDYLCYPNWLQNLPFNNLYPQVLAPGTTVSVVTSDNCQRLNLAPNCVIKTGTTDSIAAFLASGASINQINTLRKHANFSSCRSASVGRGQ